MLSILQAWLYIWHPILCKIPSSGLVNTVFLKISVPNLLSAHLKNVSESEMHLAINENKLLSHKELELVIMKLTGPV